MNRSNAAERAHTLKSRSIRPSAQRTAILHYLDTHRTHPTAETVWAALVPSLPTLSRTTVYHTLRLLCAEGLAQLLTVEEKEMRFDARVDAHGHFKCEKCGVVYDFECADTPETGLPEGFRTRERQVFCRGRCPHCC